MWTFGLYPHAMAFFPARHFHLTVGGPPITMEASRDRPASPLRFDDRRYQARGAAFGVLRFLCLTRTVKEDYGVGNGL